MEDENILINKSDLPKNLPPNEERDITYLDTLSTTANVTGKYVSSLAKGTYEYVSTIDWDNVKRNIDYGRDVLLTNIPSDISEGVPNLLRKNLSSNGTTSFKNEFSHDERFKMTKEMRIKFPNRIPVIVEKAPWSKSEFNKPKKKYLIPFDLNCQEFIFSIREHFTKNEKNKNLFLSCGGMTIIPTKTKPMKYYYENFSDSDGFLYVYFFEENIYG